MLPNLYVHSQPFVKRALSTIFTAVGHLDRLRDYVSMCSDLYLSLIINQEAQRSKRLRI